MYGMPVCSRQSCALLPPCSKVVRAVEKLQKGLLERETEVGCPSKVELTHPIALSLALRHGMYLLLSPRARPCSTERHEQSGAQIN